MILQNHLTGIVQGRPDSRQLNQHLRAVVPLLHHPLHLFQMADGPGKAVDHGFLVLVDMAVGMGRSVGVEIDMAVDRIVFMALGHSLRLLCKISCIIPVFRHFRKPSRGIF